MSKRKGLALVLFVLLAAVAACPAVTTPRVTLSPVSIPTHGHIMVRGSGFTPRKNVSSHLRRPDASEFPVLPILTDEHGEFTHDIDTLLLAIGTHELWVVDDTSQTSSNRVQFEVTSDHTSTR